jgi:esterase
MLNLVAHGPASGIPLVIAHGLFGSGRNWGVIARRLSEDRPVLAVDMRNHGESPWFDSHSYADLADDLAQVIRAHGGHADVLGHSMGGKASMMLALTRPELVRSLIVADIAPVAYSHTQMHNIRAMQALDLAGLTGRTEADQRIASHLADPALRAFFLQSLDLKSDPPRWRLNLKALEANMAHILGWPDIAHRFHGPTLFLTGALSDYLRPEHRPAISALFPKARFARLPDAGHWLHADNPRAFEAAVATWLRAQPA